MIQGLFKRLIAMIYLYRRKIPIRSLCLDESILCPDRRAIFICFYKHKSEKTRNSETNIYKGLSSSPVRGLKKPSSSAYSKWSMYFLWKKNLWSVLFERTYFPIVFCVWKLQAWSVQNNDSSVSSDLQFPPRHHPALSQRSLNASYG